jgi:uncharacterized protein YigA (DUF484 family)
MELSEANAPSGPSADFIERSVKSLLRANPEWLRGDADLLAELGLRANAGNVIEFGPVALSRVSAARRRELDERRGLEAIAKANFAAQSETHAAVLDILGAGSLTGLATGIGDLARLRFGLVAGVLALEGGDAPTGWLPLAEGQGDLILGDHEVSRLGRIPTAAGLFGTLARSIESVALVRLSIWTPARQAILAFGSRDPETFTDQMGAELLVFLGGVVERIASRWPRP